MQTRYPTSKPPVAVEATYNLDYESVPGIETELTAWHQSLPQTLPNAGDQRALYAQLLLRLQYAAVQVILYRPFLHHVNRSNQDPEFNYNGYAFGSACLKASMQVVLILDSTETQGLLHEAQWYRLDCPPAC